MTATRIHDSSCVPRDGLDLGQQIAELAVVDLHAVVEIQADTLVGIVAELLVEGLQFGLLLAELVPLLGQPLALRGRGGLGDVVASWSRREASLPWSGMTYSVRMRDGRALVVAVQVDEALEGPLLAAGEEPVDGPASCRSGRWCL